jgi:hypothetical protein
MIYIGYNFVRMYINITKYMQGLYMYTYIFFSISIMKVILGII